jgi:hypothetical protein
LWRTTLFCRLCDINETTLEEWALGLSPEFHLNIRWLPGVRAARGDVRFEEKAASKVKGLIAHFQKRWNDEVFYINVGRMETSQGRREWDGREREVYVAVIGRPDGREEIRLIHLMKWGVMHRLKMGVPLMQAIDETFQYRDYIFDRLRAASVLGIPFLNYTEIRLDEEVPGVGWIPVFFFDRQYVRGVASDKIPLVRYGQTGFISKLTGLLGVSAGISLALGRACPRTLRVYFDDGDEVIQFDEEGLPVNLVLVESTGSFTNWAAPMAEMLPDCLAHIAVHLERARGKGIGREELASAVGAFSCSLEAEINRLKQAAAAPSSGVWRLFEERTSEPGSMRARWECILRRLERTDAAELRRFIEGSSQLAPCLSH